MACTTDEFRDLLSGAADGDIDVDKVRQSARRGIPADVRAEVWKYLLLGPPIDDEDDDAVEHSGDYMDDYTDRQSLTGTSGSNSSRASPISDEYDLEVVKKVRGEIGRYERKVKPHFSQEGFIVLENVVRTFMDRHRNVEFSPALIHLCGPLVSVLRHENDVFMAFDRMMTHINTHHQQQSMHERVAQFMSLFRSIEPDLYEYFEREEVLSGHWAYSWLDHMFAREMTLPNIQRLWDCYFSEGWTMHPYICLAVLRHWRDTLEELENSEIVSFLSRLPPMDIDEIYHEAKSLLHELHNDN